MRERNHQIIATGPDGTSHVFHIRFATLKDALAYVDDKLVPNASWADHAFVVVEVLTNAIPSKYETVTKEVSQ